MVAGAESACAIREGVRAERPPQFRLVSKETRGRSWVSKPSVLVNLLQALVAIVFGNVVYFLLLPSLPLAARHQRFHVDLGMMIDFWLCLVAYGLIRTARRWR